MYYINDNNIHIEDSYKISKNEFESILCEMRKKYTNSVLKNRSNFSLKLEWAAHNFLHNLGIEKSRTQSVDLNYPQSIKEKVFYTVFGLISFIFIK